MKPIETVLLAGAGAVGLTVAGKLLDHDPDCVSVLAGGERLARYRETGLSVNGKRRAFRFADPDGGGDRRFDLIIVAVKYHQLAGAIKDMRPFVADDTVILSLLNGIASEEILGAAFGAERLPLAMIMGVDAWHEGEGTRYTVPGVIHFGDALGRRTERDARIAALFDRAGIEYRYHETDMKRALWYKFMFNTGINQVSALLRLPYGPLKRDSPRAIPEARALMYDAMAEAVAVANAEGVGLTLADREKTEDAFAGLDDSGCTSMCQDVLAGRKTEVELFSLTVMELGKKHGIDTPVNRTLYYAIRTVEQRY